MNAIKNLWNALGNLANAVNGLASVVETASGRLRQQLDFTEASPILGHQPAGEAEGNGHAGRRKAARV